MQRVTSTTSSTRTSSPYRHSDDDTLSTSTIRDHDDVTTSEEENTTETVKPRIIPIIPLKQNKPSLSSLQVPVSDRPASIVSDDDTFFDDSFETEPDTLDAGSPLVETVYMNVGGTDDSQTGTE